MTPSNLDILISGDVLADNNGQNYTTVPTGQHLGCFTTGMLGLGGKLFKNENHVEMAKKLTDGCIWAYQAMEKDVMPEIAHFIPCTTDDCAWNEDLYFNAVLQRPQSKGTVSATDVIAKEHLPTGFTSIVDPRYILRPEAIENVFIMFRITGDDKYREAAWNMFTAIHNISTTDLANAAIKDVRLPPTDEGFKDDRMESFWLAETLKYFYLIFSKPGLISLDDFVLNTEAHPLRRSH